MSDKPIKPNSRIKFSDKNGDRVASRLPTNINKTSSPEPLLTIKNSLDMLEKQNMQTEEEYAKYKNISGKPTVSMLPKGEPGVYSYHTSSWNKQPQRGLKVSFGAEPQPPDAKKIIAADKLVAYPKINREAIMQNSKDTGLQQQSKHVDKVIGDVLSGKINKDPRMTLAKPEDDKLPISKASLLCKLDKQIFTLDNMGINDEYILKAYGSFDAIPDNLLKQENRPPTGWFQKALDNMQKSDYNGNVYRYLVELWKSSDGADELLQKTIVKPLDKDEFYMRNRLVDDTAEGGEAEEVEGDPTKAKTTDFSPVKVTSTN